jgi:predicted unusual protein kinase regulating ubiquinone biosynthesis (AarF/ABC1/UbiB family)
MITNPKKRRRKAFSASFKIAWSYAKLFILKKVLGERYYSKRIEKLHILNANRTKNVILELNGLFLKVGQLISIMSNIAPEAYGHILESLQDNTPNSDFKFVKKSLETELGDSIDNLFNEFNEIPIASASIGQVHQAVLKTGELVAVKIQHPNIGELAKVDLSIIEKLIGLVSRFFKIKGIDHVYSQVKEMIYEELNYTAEAYNMETISLSCEKMEGIIIPKVYSEYSSGKILTTAFCEGTKITNVKQLNEWGIDENGIAEKLIFVYCEMILNHGYYHADPHPGNLLVNKNGDIIILDFGAIGRLNDEMRETIPVLVRAIVSKDQEAVLDALKKMGFIANGKEANKTAQKLISALTELFESGINIREFSIEDLNNSTLKEFRKTINIKELSATIQVPKDWILLERAIMLLDGVTAKLAPEYKPFDTIKPYLKKLVLKNGGLRKLIVGYLKKQISTLVSLPKKADKFLERANNGELEFEIKDLDKSTNKLYAGSQQIGFGIVSVFSLAMAFVSNVYGKANYETLFMVIGVTFGTVLVWSIFKNRK